MHKEDCFEVKGTVIEVERNGLCKIETVQGKIIYGVLSGKIRTFKIKVLKGDKVTVLMTKYDLTKGRIIHREKVFKEQNSDKNKI